MNKSLFENIYKASLNSRLKEYSYDMNSRQIVEFFKKELFHPSVEYAPEMKAAMSSCIKLLSSMRDSKEYRLNDVYKILESLYKGISRLSEGIYADNLGNDIDELIRKAEDSFDDLVNKQVELNIKDSKIDDVENKLFAIADIYNRTLQLIKGHVNFRNEEKAIAQKLLVKLHTVVRNIFDYMKRRIKDLSLRGITLYHSVGNREEIKEEDLCLNWYLKNLKFADMNAINKAFELAA